MKHFLTYADNYAIGYFKKQVKYMWSLIARWRTTVMTEPQGFTTEITLDRRKWVGYIKDYEGGTIMQCTMVPKVEYCKVKEILAIQKDAVLEKTKENSTSHVVYPGIDMPVDEHGKRSIDPLDIPGVRKYTYTLSLLGEILSMLKLSLPRWIWMDAGNGYAASIPLALPSNCRM